MKSLVILLLTVTSCGVAALSAVYPKIYDKRTAFYDDLVKQIESETATKLLSLTPSEVGDDVTLFLGGTELFLNGYSNAKRFQSSQEQFIQLKQQFPPLQGLNAFYLNSDASLVNTALTPLNVIAPKISKINGANASALVSKFSQRIKSEDLSKLAFWIPASMVSSEINSTFRQLLAAIWSRDLTLVSSTIPVEGQDFVFTLAKQDTNLISGINKALQQTQKSLVFMFPPPVPKTLLILYPQTKAPRDAIYKQIIEGIQQQFTGSIDLIAIDRGDDAEALAANIDQRHPDMVISLSSSGKKIARMLKVKLPWVSGATQLWPTDISGISPVAAPKLILSYLNQLAPDVTRVQVVFGPKSKWLVDLASVAAQNLGLQLITHRVHSRKEAIVKYTELFKHTDYKTDAFWLPYDSLTANDKYVLPLVLDASWDKRFVVISSIPPHAKRGALLSLYPDNAFTGVNLVKMVENMYVSSSQAGVIPTWEVMLAVNLRTASHLGLEYTAKQKGQFHFTFPSR